ncbi:MAG: glucose-6-phosphate isomerase [Bacteroidota bacterium]
MSIKVSYEKILDFVSKKEILQFEDKLQKAQKAINNKTGKGNDFLGWVDLPLEISPVIVKDINDTATALRMNSDCVVIIGIGGSYLGAKALIEALNHHFSSLLKTKTNPDIIFAGHQLSEDYMTDLLELLDNKDYSIVVISKSGTTTEPAVAFRILKEHIEKKYGKENAKNRIVAITDKSRGALKTTADAEGYKSYIIPDDVGGRYSVLTPVGLLPFAIAGFDISTLVEGAVEMREQNINNNSIETNIAFKYAAARNALYSNNFNVEIMVNYQPNLMFFTEWWKQLYGESEGKENKGIFPAGVSFTTDLHSMGQYIQEGLRMIFETVISVEKPKSELKVNSDSQNLDGLNFIVGKRLNEVNKMAELGTMIAHVDGGVPNIRIAIPELNEYYLGQLIFFFEYGCALSGYLLDVNPFDQPGVEAYKNNMFALLGKPGFEKQTEQINKRIGK